MTNEELITGLGHIAHTMERNGLSYHQHVAEDAIKALEQGDVLEKIRSEINEWYWQADKQALAKDPCVVDAMVDLFIRTIDKYKAESEEICEP